MKIRAQFFGQLRDVASASELQIELGEDATVADLLGAIYQQFPALHDWDRNILVGVGVEFVERDYVLQPNDIIAVMPPVQGG